MSERIEYGPGVWSENGELHFDTVECLKVLGLPVTPENEQRFIELAKETARKMNPRLNFVEKFK